MTRESLNRQKTRKSKSYLVHNPYLKFLVSNTRSIKSLPILKNGSRFQELKSCRSKQFHGKFVFTNTCAFDSLSVIINYYGKYLQYFMYYYEK